MLKYNTLQMMQEFVHTVVATGKGEIGVKTINQVDGWLTEELKSDTLASIDTGFNIFQDAKRA